MDKIDSEIQKRIQEWLDGPFDEKTKEEIRALQKSSPQTLIDCFYSGLSFGTGGMRALMGVGTTRMNIYTVRMATQGLANYILKQKISHPSILIGFDSRHHSTLFAQEVASVMAANKIRVFLLKELRPTPFVSFGCREKKCTAAVMITASHNPKEYNGYKVYWTDGAQVVPPHDTGIMSEVAALKGIQDVKLSAPSNPLIQVIGAELDEAYLKAIAGLQHFPEDNQRDGPHLKITYTSLHGTGITLMPAALKLWGFTSVNFVDKQIIPDGDFPTVRFPNPEYKETLDLGIKRLIETQSDLFIASDPDADRLGVVAMHQGKPIILTGNEIASICVEFLCKTLQAQKKMPPKGAFVTTIVTTELIKTIAAAYGAACFEVLTGFKYIGEKIHEWESHPGGYQYIFGAEESYGSLLGTQARDKDAIVAGCFYSEIALHAKKQGLTLVDLLYQIYQKYGIFREGQYSIAFPPGEEGHKQMSALMARLRKSYPQMLCGSKVLLIEDYLKQTRYDLISGKQEPLTLPASDVLLFRLDDQSKIVIRPSGTEPKVKIYGAVHQKTFSSILSGITECDNRLKQLFQSIQNELK